MDQNDWDTQPKKKKASSGDWDISAGVKQPSTGGWEIGGGDPPLPAQKVSTGGWHWLLSTLSIALTGGTAFLFAWLSKDIEYRSVPLVGLMFMAPAAVLTFTAFLLEQSTSMMTPWYSRNQQAILAAALSAAVFLTGCLAQLSYVIADVQTINYIFLVDKSISMGYDLTSDGNDSKNQRSQALGQVLEKLKDGTVVGLVLFNETILEQEGPIELNTNMREDIRKKLEQYDSGTGTNFYLPLDAALGMLENKNNVKILGGRTTRIVMLTDGDAPLVSDDFLSRFIEAKASLSCVRLGKFVSQNEIAELIKSTDGKILSIDTADQLTQGLAAVSAGKEADVLRDESAEARWICGVLFILTGLLIGIGLSLMLSRQKQFRAQLILSPIFGAASFVICKYVPGMTDWVREGIAFSVFGMVFMKKNRLSELIQRDSTTHQAANWD